MVEADIVVVGAGSGGSTVAGRLSENDRYSVVLLEAGGENKGYLTRIPGMMAFQTHKTDWKFDTVPQPRLNGRVGYQPRGRGLGGSNAINALLYVRGNKWDYDNWAAIGATGWSYDEVLPYFKRSENNGRGADALHGGDGPFDVRDQVSPHPGAGEFIESARSVGISVNDDFNGPSQDGVGMFQVTQRDGERWSAANAFLGQKRANLEIRTNAIVQRVLFEDGRAVGVAYLKNGKEHIVRAKRAVVMAGGVFATPQLLMLSGIGPAAHLHDHGIAVQVDRPAVGTNLQDHFDYILSYAVPGTFFLGQSVRGTLFMAGQMLEWFRRRRGTMTSPFAESGGFIRVTPDAPAPDILLHFVNILLEDHGRKRVTEHGFSLHVAVLRPESTGTVRLASADVNAAPLIDPAFLSDPRDLDLLRAGIRAAYRIVQASPLADHGGRDRYPVDPNDDAALETLIRARSDSIYHPVGTARMGSDADAVCDPRLRVRGVEGLYVADASAMPKIVSGNTNAATVMIAERCADFIAADLA